jgi:hypothetical protein
LTLIWVKGDERGIYIKVPINATNQTILKAFDAYGKPIEKYEGPWLDQENGHANYLRGFTNATIYISEVGNIRLAHEYWTDPYKLSIGSIAFLYALILIWGFYQYKKERKRREEEEEQKDYQ